jgi:hypothetical protein
MTERPAPAAKAAAKARFAKLAQKAYDEERITKPTAPTPAAKAVATKPKKKITKPTAPTAVVRMLSDFDDL